MSTIRELVFDWQERFSGAPLVPVDRTACGLAPRYSVPDVEDFANA